MISSRNRIRNPLALSSPQSIYSYSYNENSIFKSFKRNAAFTKAKLIAHDHSLAS